MAIARVIDYWTHDLASGVLTLHVVVTDRVPSTLSERSHQFPDSVLPAAFKTWEQARATALGATLALSPKPEE